MDDNELAANALRETCTSGSIIQDREAIVLASALESGDKRIVSQSGADLLISRYEERLSESGEIITDLTEEIERLRSQNGKHVEHIADLEASLNEYATEKEHLEKQLEAADYMAGRLESEVGPRESITAYRAAKEEQQVAVARERFEEYMADPSKALTGDELRERIRERREDDHLRREVEEVIESLKQNRSYYTDSIMRKLQRALVMEE